MYTYAWYHWLTFFYLYCFFGWIFESSYVSVKKHRLVNRGFLHLPMLPLYGTGAVMMLWVSLPVKDHLILVYLSGVIAATLLEYVTGYMMERLFKVKYWDYSSQRFQLNGYICLSSSIAWGFLTILMTKVIHRPIERLILDVPPLTEAIFLSVTSVLFTADAIRSTKEALDLAHALETVTRLRTELDELQVQLALLKAEATQSIQEFRDMPRPAHPVAAFLHRSRTLALREIRRRQPLALRNAPHLASHLINGSSASRIRALRELSDTRWELLMKRLSERNDYLRQQLNRRYHILLRNPGASSSRFAAALKELKDNWTKF